MRVVTLKITCDTHAPCRAPLCYLCVSFVIVSNYLCIVWLRFDDATSNSFKQNSHWLEVTVRVPRQHPTHAARRV